MSYLEELLLEFRNGAKIRRKNWVKGEYIQLSKDKIFAVDKNDKIYTVYSEELLADNWELYTEPQPDYDYIIKNKCLCWFWDDDEKFGRYGRLTELLKGTFVTLNEEGCRIQYENCRPVRKDEITFYENKKNDDIVKAFDCYVKSTFKPIKGIKDEND